MRRQALLDALCNTTPERFADSCFERCRDEDLSDDALRRAAHFHPLWHALR